MQLFTNPGLNVSAAEIERYRVVLTPQRIMVDDVEHDTRAPISFATIDGWMKTAKHTPHMVGTTAAELSDAFRRTLKTDPEMIVVTASRKLIATHQAVLSAARTVTAMAGARNLHIEPIDCGSTDLAGAMAVVYVGEAHKAGLSYERALVANLLDVSPVIAFTAGEMHPQGRTKRSEAAAAMIEHIVKKIGRGTAIWAGVAHRGNESEAQRLARALKETFDVQRTVIRPMRATTYLNVGPQGLGVYHTRVDALPWVPRRAEP